MIRKIPLFGVVHLPEMEQAALEIMRSGKIAHGNYVSMFEETLAGRLGQPNLLTTADVTSAIHLALHLSGVVAGDEVISTAYACMSTNATIAAMGAKAVWVDIMPDSVCIDLQAFESAITPLTKAVILYHVAGYPGPAKEIAEICQRRGVKFIEDCDNAMFSKINQSYVGSFGDFAVYSFYPNRHINTMEGGGLVCRTKEDSQKAKQLRRFGINLSSFRLPSGEINPDLDIPEAGWSYTMSNLCAAIGYTQLNTIDERLKKTSENVKRMIKSLSGFPQIYIVPCQEGGQPAHWVLLIQLACRDEVNYYLKNRGIESSILHYRNDRYTCFGRNSSILPNTTKFQKTVLALPCGWWLDEQNIKYIMECLSSAISEYNLPEWKSV